MSRPGESVRAAPPPGGVGEAPKGEDPPRPPAAGIGDSGAAAAPAAAVIAADGGDGALGNCSSRLAVGGGEAPNGGACRCATRPALALIAATA